jgi:hypothetical protein
VEGEVASAEMSLDVDAVDVEGVDHQTSWTLTETSACSSASVETNKSIAKVTSSLQLHYIIVYIIFTLGNTVG